MGSWSVHCGISNIAITSGQECVVLPIKSVGDTATRFVPYLAATLPIFGVYDDYGGIEDIVEDENTKLIEEHFGVSIDEFVYYFTRGHYGHGDADYPDHLLENKEMKDWDFMFIDRKIFDFLSGEEYGFWGKGYLDFGNHEILELIGFEYQGKVDKERYNKHYMFEDTDVYSDGTWLHLENNQAIYNFNGEKNSLSNIINVPEDKKWIGEKSMVQLWEHLSDIDIKLKLLWVLNVDRYKVHNEELNKILDKPEDSIKTLNDKYYKNIRIHGDLLCKLVVLMRNIHPMSGYLRPFVIHQTPQCGERKEHQRLLYKFSEINKSYINEEE